MIKCQMELELTQLLTEYKTIRKQTEKLCAPLCLEDYVIQSMLDVSPPKWHLAHTTWFFEVFILKYYYPGYRVYNEKFHQLFNSYYLTFGDVCTRSQRGLLARPTVAEIKAYRVYVDDAMIELSNLVNNDAHAAVNKLLEVGLHHEMQHQELLLTDIKHIFAFNPLFPIYCNDLTKIETNPRHTKPEYLEVDGGLIEVGYQGECYCYDNELPRHKQYLQPFRVCNRLATNAEYLAFINNRGYKRNEFWLSDGWDWLQRENTKAPLYWHLIDGVWHEMTLAGLQVLNLSQPVCHVSFYEADAFARWTGKRLLTEFEWEHLAVLYQMNPQQGNFMENNIYQPAALSHVSYDKPNQLFGDVWEWTASAYSPYPGYQRAKGALGEYNAKFMSNQMVLRGGSCLTPKKQIRSSYRNFFQPEKRWIPAGIRLAECVD